MYLTGKKLSRRSMLRGAGAVLLLPDLDAMAPVIKPRVRLVCVEMVHGAAGSSKYGIESNLWAPAKTGRDFDLSSTSLKSLAGFRDSLTIVSNTDVPTAEADDIREFGGDHYRTSSVFLTQAHPKRTEGPDLEAGISLDQVCAQSLGNACPIPSLQLCIEGADQGCGFGYSCVYTDCISWAAANKPLPMIRNPRMVFDELHSVLGGKSWKEDKSILDWLKDSITRLRLDLGASDQARLADYLDHVRQVEQRIQHAEAAGARQVPKGLVRPPSGIPASFAEHVKLMFDLQLLALTTDATRVISFKLGRDNPNRSYPGSGIRAGFHPASHHGDRPDRIQEFAQLNAYHVGILRYFLEKLQGVKEDGASLLDNSLILYGSGMGDSNEHKHKSVPFFLAGHAGGKIQGGRHIRATRYTSLADAMLGVLHNLGLEQLKEFGDSERALGLNG